MMPHLPTAPRAARLIRSLSALACLVAVSACAGGGGVEAIYGVNAAHEFAGLSGETSAQILIPEPQASQALAVREIAVRPTVNSYSYYERVAWEDTAPRMFQLLLLATFQNSDRVKAVGLPGQSLLINYQVVTEIRAFQVESFAQDWARVEVAAKLLNDSNGRVVASEIFAARIPIAGDTVPFATAGLEAAAQAVAADILQWTLRNI